MGLKNYEVEFWVNTPDGYDNRYTDVKAISKTQAVKKAKEQNPRGKSFKAIINNKKQDG